MTKKKRNHARCVPNSINDVIDDYDVSMEVSNFLAK